MQWLAIAPLLALSSTLIQSLVAGSIMFILLLTMSVTVAGVRLLIPSGMRIPVLLLLVSTFVSLMDMGMKYFFYELHQSFDIYLPLIAVNSLIYAITGDCFFNNSLKHSLRQAVITGTVFMILFLSLGACREAAGYGTIFREIEMLTGDPGPFTVIHLPGGVTGLSLIHTPPGALITCGLLAALIRCIFKERLSIAATGIH